MPTQVLQNQPTQTTLLLCLHQAQIESFLRLDPLHVLLHRPTLSLSHRPTTPSRHPRPEPLPPVPTQRCCSTLHPFPVHAFLYQEKPAAAERPPASPCPPRAVSNPRTKALRRQRRLLPLIVQLPAFRHQKAVNDRSTLRSSLPEGVFRA